MGRSKFRKAIGAVKDRTSISIAKVSSSTSMSDPEVAVLKATRHDEYPTEERHVMEILSMTSYSKAYISSCVSLISKRLSKTKNWTVALKTLMLSHRLLIDGDPAYEQEMFFATRRGTRLLNMSDFRDKSRSGSWDFSAFVRTYALYLDEQLEYRMQGRRRRSRSSMGGAVGDDDECLREEEGVGATTPVREMRTERIFVRTHHLQQLLDRFLACRPTGAAKANRVVLVALYPLVRQSFQLYYDLTEIMGVLIDRFMELQIPDCVKVHDIFARMAKQFDELNLFFNWCKSVGVARSSEYPEVERIAPKKLDLMEEFIRDKSALQLRKLENPDQLELAHDHKEDQVQDPQEEDLFKIKALPPPEGFDNNDQEPVDREEANKEEDQKIISTQQEADLLNLGEDHVTSEEQGDRLALALFDGKASTAMEINDQETQDHHHQWVAFTSGDSSDWEATLVQSASHLNKQKPILGGGFDMLLLDGMYKQSINVNATSSGSSSSVALGAAPVMLALPAPPGKGAGSVAGDDPFAASLAVAPPAYVQMSEMENKQRLLVEEQLMWQQYARDGLKGSLGVPHNNLYGCNRSYY